MKNHTYFRKRVWKKSKMPKNYIRKKFFCKYNTYTELQQIFRQDFYSIS